MLTCDVLRDHRALLLLHRRKPSCLDESHDITSRAAVLLLLRQQGPAVPLHPLTADKGPDHLSEFR